MNEALDFASYEADVIAKSKKSFIPGYEWEDIAQELRIALWKKLQKFSPQKASSRTYAQLIMRSKIRDLVKFSGRKKRYFDNNCLSLEEQMDKGIEDFSPFFSNTIYLCLKK